jgi:hypothetical protein
MLNETEKSDLSLLKEKEEIFITELLKSGIEPQKAVRAAKILASEKSDEQLTPEEIQLVEAACSAWLKQRKRLDFINQVLQKNVAS